MSRPVSTCRVRAERAHGGCGGAGLSLKSQCLAGASFHTPAGVATILAPEDCPPGT